MRRSILNIIVILFAFALVPQGGASPSHGSEETYGSTPGDPRVIADAGACYNATLDKPGTACSVLYGHPFDILNNIMINTQRVPDYWHDMARGFQPNAGYEGLWDLNALSMESTPGFVEYKGPGEEPDLHMEHGITRTVDIDTSIPIVGYWYLSADYDEGFGQDDLGGHGPDAGILPCLTVRMTLQEGRYWQKDDPLAVGEVTKTVVSARAAENGTELDVPETPCPGARTQALAGPEAVTEFEVVLEPLAKELSIPGDKGFIVHVEWYQWAPGDPDKADKVYQSQWNFHNGPQHLNRVILPTQTNLWVEEVSALHFDKKLYVQGVVNSPWGSYDVDPASLTLRLYDEGGDEVPIEHVEEPILRYSTGHDGHFDPVRATFPWDYQLQDLEPGRYTIELSARNWQHLAEASGTTTILVQDGKEPVVTPSGTVPPPVEKDTPMVGAPLLIVALGALVMGLRRRWVG